MIVKWCKFHLLEGDVIQDLFDDNSNKSFGLDEQDLQFLEEDVENTGTELSVEDPK